MAQLYDHRGERSSRDQNEQQIETSALLNEFVLRLAQIEQGRHPDLRQYTRRIEEEATSRRFDERGQPALEVGRHLAETIDRIDAEYGEEIQSLVDMTDYHDTDKTVERVAQNLFKQGEDLSTGRIAALLLYCYRLIQRVEREEVVERRAQTSQKKVVLAVAGVGVIGLVAIILYNVFIKIDFFNWLVRKGGWAIFKSGQDAIDGIGNALSGFGRKCFEYVQDVMGAGITLTSAGLTAANPIRSRIPAAATVNVAGAHNMGRTIIRIAGQYRAAGVLMLPVAVATGFVSWWWWTRKSK